MTTTRHHTRSVVLQALFENEFKHESFDAKTLYGFFERTHEEYSPGKVDKDFAKTLIEGISSKISELDKIIVEAATDWPLERIPIIDRNILRIGIFELLFGKAFDTPARVAINESIELAKEYGGDRSGKFINGVLGSVFSELGVDITTPDEETVSNRVQKSVGGLVYSKLDNELYFALVFDVFGKWSISKGKIANRDIPAKEVSKKIFEELGIKSAVVIEEIGSNSYVSHPPEGTVRKEVTYFLLESEHCEIDLKESGGLKDAKWFREDQVNKLTTYKDLSGVIKLGMERAQEIQKEIQKHE